MLNTHLKNTLSTLRLSGLGSSLEIRLQEAQSRQLPYLDFLELLLQDELDMRESRKISRRQKSAGFRDLKSLDDFDFTFNPNDQIKVREEVALKLICTNFL